MILGHHFNIASTALLELVNAGFDSLSLSRAAAIQPSDDNLRLPSSDLRSFARLTEWIR